MNRDYTYSIRLDIDKDIWNWYGGCNRTSYGIDWKGRIPENIYNKVFNVEKSAANEFLYDYLSKKYINDKNEIEKYISFINKEFGDKFCIACSRIKNITKRKLYRNEFEIFLTTFPRGPYNFENGQIWIAIGWRDPIKNFLHELLHFQFINYFRNNPDSPVSNLSDDQFNYLKESMTIILNYDFSDIMLGTDRGYEIHQRFRDSLLENWKIHHDFDKLVEFGLKKLPEYCKN